METVIVIIVSACNFLMVDPATKEMVCRDFELPPFTEQISPLQCIVGAQAQVAKTWWPKHTGWTIKKITCEQRRGFGSNNDETAKRDI